MLNTGMDRFAQHIRPAAKAGCCNIADWQHLKNEKGIWHAACITRPSIFDTTLQAENTTRVSSRHGRPQIVVIVHRNGFVWGWQAWHISVPWVYHRFQDERFTRPWMSIWLQPRETVLFDMRRRLLPGSATTDSAAQQNGGVRRRNSVL